MERKKKRALEGGSNATLDVVRTNTVMLRRSN